MNTLSSPVLSALEPQPGRSAEAVRPARPVRRRGTILILVMTVLGVLFVTGVAFMATMSFEAELVSATRARAAIEPDVERVAETVNNVITDTMLVANLGQGLPTLDEDSAASYVELPGVHNLSAPIEPYRLPDRMVFGWSTDLKALTAEEFTGSAQRGNLKYNLQGYVVPNPESDPINTWAEMGEQYDTNGDFKLTDETLMWLDADGDGITDTLGRDIIENPPPGMSRRQLREIARLVNAPSKPDGRVFLGLRVLNHGGMVNLNYSSPMLIENLLGRLSNNHGLYTPLTEEPILRHRFMLLPPELPPSKILGNPFSTDAQLGEGDFANELLKLEVPRKPRYWMYNKDEYGDNPGVPLWQARMDADQANPDDPGSDEYLRRHLVTTIGHDDLLARPTIVPVQIGTCTINNSAKDNVYGPFCTAPGSFSAKGIAQVDLIDYLIQWQRLSQTLPTFDPNANNHMDDQFPLLNYPQRVFGSEDNPTAPHGVVLTDEADVVNTAGANQKAAYDWSSCLYDPACVLNPRKGRLKLSLRWLAEAMSAPPSGDPPVFQSIDQAIPLIQDAFTLLLLNARGAERGSYESIPVLNSNNQVEYKGYWAPDFDVIARTAASLTANFIDYYDADDIPTRVELRSADYTNPLTFGQPTSGAAYGVEPQPFITQVFVLVEDGASGSVNLTKNWYFAVELFNPYDFDITINAGGKKEYSLNPGKGAVPLPTTTIGPRQFVGFEYSSDKNGLRPPGSNASAVSDLADVLGPPDPTLFAIGGQANRSVELYRGVGGTQVLIDRFDLPMGVGDWLENPGVMESAERIASPVYTQSLPGLGRPEWYAPLRLEAANTKPEGLAVGTPVNPFQLSGAPGTPGTHPLEVMIANAGTIPAAYPTTGSLLLLLREAHYLQTGIGGRSEPFNERLHLTAGSVDNGRMPIFDAMVDAFQGGQPNRQPMRAHRLDPVYEADNAGQFVNVLTTTNQGDPVPPGDAEHLPWGQFVFDYFTTLSLSSPGPFDNNLYPDPVDKRAAPPRVDSNGLMVHGRINLNVAPWRVLEGLSFVPVSKFDKLGSSSSIYSLPFLLQSSLSQLVLLPQNRDEPTPIGEDLAKAIVAYRELRELDNQTGKSTGDFDTIRGWNSNQAAVRRGTGFLTVGELANVRNPNAPVTMRFDGGLIADNLTAPGQSSLGFGQSYIRAVAPLVALSEWATVRSHVYTVYGVIRGEEDPEIDDAEDRRRDANNRALRFQETVDRLPVLLGAEKPDRLGERVIGRYTDVRGN